MNRNHVLMESARSAKRAGLPIEAVLKGLKPEFAKFEPEIRAEYDRTRKLNK